MNLIHRLGIRPCFVEKILSGQKRTLIRSNAHGIYSGDCILFFENFCQRTPQFTLSVKVESPPSEIILENDAVFYSGQWAPDEIGTPSLDQIARLDGFGNWREMRAWFQRERPPRGYALDEWSYTGMLIHFSLIEK